MYILYEVSLALLMFVKLNNLTPFKYLTQYEKS